MGLDNTLLPEPGKENLSLNTGGVLRDGWWVDEVFGCIRDINGNVVYDPF